MKYFIYTYTILVLFTFQIAFAQIGINTRNPNPASAIDINTTDKGFLITRIAIASKNDITTIENPVKGMIVIATQNSNASVTENDKVSIGMLLKFNGIQWEEIILEEQPSVGILAPELVAYGEKTSTNTNIEGQSSGTFSLETIKKIRPEINLNANGSLTADREGYYTWSIKIFFYIKNSSSSNALGYFSPGNIVYSFEAAPDAISWAKQPFSLTGSAYLTSGQTSSPFLWKLISSAGVATPGVVGDKMDKQTVLWQYLGK